MNEAMAIAEVRAGNAAAYQILVERYQTPVTRYLERLLGSRAPAEEVAQEAFITAFYAISKKGQGRATRYLAEMSPAMLFYHYATQRVLAYGKPSLMSRLLPFVRRRQEQVSTIVPEHTRFAPPPIARPLVEEPVQTSAERVEQERLQEALLRLPREQAACLLLHSMLGFSYTEVASILRVPLNVVRVQIGRARQTLIAT